MWEAVIQLVGNLAQTPQILAIILIEGARILVRRESGGGQKLTASGHMTRYEFVLRLWWSFLNAAPSLGLVASIFFVRF